MKLNLQYLQLHRRYAEGDSAEVTLAEIAEELDCTHRSAVTLIGKLTGLGWIEWTARRGRGRRSTLRFLAEPRAIARASVRQAMNTGQLRRSLEQLTHHAAPEAEAPLEEWLASYFGHHAEIRQNRQIDILRLPIREQLHSIDPLAMNLLAESFVSSHVFDGLVRRSFPDGAILPNLAHAWESDDSRTRWTFHLRKGVAFHDGRLLTADDVVYSLERLIHSKRTLYGSLFRQIQSVRAWTSATVVVELNHPNELMLPLLCTSRAAIVPAGTYEASQSGSDLPVGTGPFKLLQLGPQLCVLEAYPHYHLGRAQLDRVEIVHVPWRNEHEPADPHAPFHIMHHAGEPDTGWSRISSETVVRKFITCNTRREGPLANPGIRADIMGALAGQTEPYESQAQQHGQVVSPLRITTIEHYRQDAEQVADRLRAAGYRCEVTTSSPDSFKDERRLRADLILFSLLRDQDVQLRLYDLYATMQSHLDEPTAARVDHTLTAVSTEADAQRRMAWLRVLEAELIDGHQLHILYEKPVQAAYLPSVRGVSFNAQGWMDLRKLWFPPVQEELPDV
ncbi:ABC transporter substrate-binding protein [Paenibacillus daejeonensis]|uniref:ABC transporter substrate-binding protein n=1 Tax=Paenibacillus daejeonensis TaxID=135193 RepID=UPI00037C38D5|nr:ABC transporter substrate-binding protein [Paenibacillus daejeonensis]